LFAFIGRLAGVSRWGTSERSESRPTGRVISQFRRAQWPAVLDAAWFIRQKLFVKAQLLLLLFHHHDIFVNFLLLNDKRNTIKLTVYQVVSYK
jgi:hypothetical protein